MKPDKAFILAAGLGTRMRPYTDNCPKPLMRVAGRSLLDRTLDHLEIAGVMDVVINIHYLAGQITGHLGSRKTPRIHFSHEEELLDTGGGIRNALFHFGDKPFYVLSGDGLWNNGKHNNSLEQLASAWNPEIMDMALLLQPISSMKLTKGIGDYDFEEEGKIKRCKERNGQYMFTSMRINHPRIFDRTSNGAFSYLELMDQAEAQGRLYGVANDGEWHHISTPANLDGVDEVYKKRRLIS